MRALLATIWRLNSTTSGIAKPPPNPTRPAPILAGATNQKLKKMNITERTNIVKTPAGPGGWASYEIYDRQTGNLIGRESDYRTAQRIAREYANNQTTQND